MTAVQPDARPRRSRPRPEMDVDAYLGISAAFFLAEPIMSASARLGPRFAADARSVTPTSMERVAPCMQSLIDGGSHTLNTLNSVGVIVHQSF